MEKKKILSKGVYKNARQRLIGDIARKSKTQAAIHKGSRVAFINPNK